ncbi:MAG TPA: hypothetical protein VFA67_01205, partial [Candidatus Sulfotelmatobacter sp.]|nr:hypothetical protein [Candidatus Sulfotelmatobacter sp.]
PFESAFKTPAGALLDPVTVAGATVVARVVEHSEADMSLLVEVQDQILESLLEARVMAKLTKQGVVTVHDDAIKRIAAGYRGVVTDPAP